MTTSVTDIPKQPLVVTPPEGKAEQQASGRGEVASSPGTQASTGGVAQQQPPSAPKTTQVDVKEVLKQITGSTKLDSNLVKVIEQAVGSLGDILPIASASRGTQSTGGKGVMSSSVVPSLEIPSVEPEDFDSLFVALRMKLMKLSSDTSVQDLKGKMEVMRTKNTERQKDLDEVVEKIEEAESQSIWGKVCGWVASIATLIAGIALCVAGGAGAALIVAAVISITILALEESGGMDKMVEGMTPGFEDMLKFFGCSDKDAKAYAGMAARITIAVVAMAASIAAMVFTGGASGVQTAQQITKLIQIARMVSMMAKLASAASQIAGGAIQITSGVARGKAAIQESEVKLMEAMLKKLQQMIEMSMEALEEMEEKMQDCLRRVMAMLSASNESRSKTVGNMA